MGSSEYPQYPPVKIEQISKLRNHEPLAGKRVLILGGRVDAQELRAEIDKDINKRGSGETIVGVRDPRLIKLTFLGVHDTENYTKSDLNIPEIVYLFPRMRIRDEEGLEGYVDTWQSGISEMVEKLCDDHHVELVYVNSVRRS